MIAIYVKKVMKIDYAQSVFLIQLTNITSKIMNA